jgi:hypothetical protein
LAACLLARFRFTLTHVVALWLLLLLLARAWREKLWCSSCTVQLASLLALSFGFDVYTYQLMIPASKLQEYLSSVLMIWACLRRMHLGSFGSSLAL